MDEGKSKREAVKKVDWQSASKFVAFLRLPPAHRQEKMINMFITCYLQNIKYFNELNLTMEQYKRLLSCMTIETFKKGETVFNYGQYGEKFYFIVHGRVEVWAPVKAARAVDNTKV